jgi:hypothetical protein
LDEGHSREEKGERTVNLRQRFAHTGLLLLLAWSTAQADVYEDLNITTCNNANPIKFAAKVGDVVNEEVAVTNASTTVFWGLETGSGCSGTESSITCNGPQAARAFTITAPTGPVAQGTNVKITGTPAASHMGTQGLFNIVVTSTDPSGLPTCTGRYDFRVNGTGGGWGDPHITTVDGVHYDFQSAGEFTALRHDELEIQTRQTAVPSASIPITNEYTGLRSCVSIYTAFAARIGSSRVTLQPNLSGEPDPSGMQLRVNGKLVTLTDAGLDLITGGGTGDLAASAPRRTLDGRIVQSAGQGIEITDVHGTKIVVSPDFWASQGKWYLNVNVYQTIANQGIMGRIAEGSWLPAMPDGSSLGPKPDSTSQRYQDLYEKFADAWRVTDTTSLFDYAPGTNTATFTLDEWPRDNPQSCDIQGQTSVQPATPEVAQQACSGVNDATLKADCVFDVTVTGDTIFAEGYQVMQRIEPPAGGWQNSLPGTGPNPDPGGSSTSWPWWWIVILLILILALLAWFLRRLRSS